MWLESCRLLQFPLSPERGDQGRLHDESLESGKVLWHDEACVRVETGWPVGDYPRLRVYHGLDDLLIDERTQVLFLGYVALLNEMFAEVNITAARPAGLRNKTPERTRSRSVGDERGGNREGRKSLSAEKLKVRQHQTV